MKLLGIIIVGFYVKGQLLNRFSAFVRYWRKNGSTMRQYIRYLWISRKPMDSVRRDVLYNILIGLGVPMKLIRLIEICLNETHSKVRIGKHLSENFPIQNDLKQGDALSPLLSNFALEYVIRMVQEHQVGLVFNGTHQLPP
jgi:hypothetical protein